MQTYNPAQLGQLQQTGGEPTPLRIQSFLYSKVLTNVLLVFITVVALVIRLVALGKWSFWIDEIATIVRAQNIMANLVTFPPPALSNILTHFSLAAFGVNEWSARLVSALFGVLSIVLLYYVIKEIFDPGVALIAVFLLAISPWHLFWSQSARFYTALMLFYSLSIFLFYLGIERGRSSLILLSILMLLFAIAERLVALLAIPTILLYLIVLEVASRKKLTLRSKYLIPFFLLLGLVLLFVLYDVYRLLTSGSSFLTDKLNWFFAFPIDDPFRLAIFIVLSIGIPVMCLAVFAGMYLVFQKERAGLLLLIGAVFPVLVVIAVSPFMFAKERYVFMTLPFWVTLAAYSVKRLAGLIRNYEKLLVVGILSLLVAGAMNDDLMYFSINHGNRYDWESAFAIVNATLEKNDHLVSTRPQIADFYTEGNVEDFLDISPRSVEQGENRVWFVIDSEKSWDNPKLKSWVEANSRLVDFQYLRLPEELNLRIYLYDPGLIRPGGNAH